MHLCGDFNCFGGTCQLPDYLTYKHYSQDESSEEEDDAYEPTDAETEEDSDDGSEYDSEASDESDASGDSEGNVMFKITLMMWLQGSNLVIWGYEIKVI